MTRSPAILILLSVVLLSGCSQRPIETVRASGHFQFNQGDYTAAAEEFKEITTRYPGDWNAHYRLGLCLLELEKPSEARRAMEVAHTHRPRDPQIADALAEAMYQQGDEAALFRFLRHRAESSQSVGAYLRLASYAVDMGDPDTAQLAYETAIVIDAGRTVEPYLEAAAFAWRLGDVDEALRRLRQAYSVNPRDSRVGQCLRELGEVPGLTIALPPGK